MESQPQNPENKNKSIHHYREQNILEVSKTHVSS